MGQWWDVIKAVNNDRSLQLSQMNERHGHWATGQMTDTSQWIGHHCRWQCFFYEANEARAPVTPRISNLMLRLRHASRGHAGRHEAGFQRGRWGPPLHAFSHATVYADELHRLMAARAVSWLWPGWATHAGHDASAFHAFITVATLLAAWRYHIAAVITTARHDVIAGHSH